MEKTKCKNILFQGKMFDNKDIVCFSGGLHMNKGKWVLHIKRDLKLYSSRTFVNGSIDELMSLPNEMG